MFGSKLIESVSDQLSESEKLSERGVGGKVLSGWHEFSLHLCNRLRMHGKPKQVFEISDAYKDLFDNALDLIHVLEPDGTILYVNKAWQKNLGYSEAEITGKRIDEFVNPSDLGRFREYRTGILTQKPEAEQIIIGLVARSGAVLFAEGVVTAKFVDGKPVYTRGIFRNVTQRLRNEAELAALHEQIKEREANLRQLFYYAPDAIVVIDPHSLIAYWNPKAEQIFGWSQEEVLGKPLTDFIIPPQYREAHNAGMKRYLANGETRVMNKTIEITALNKAGREFYVSLTISSTWHNGQQSFIAFIRDIDEQRRNARELEKKKEQLEASNEQLEQFAHVISHDLKEPVRKIVMFADLLRSEVGARASERARMLIAKIETAAGRLFNMVEGVLRNSSVRGEELVVEKVDLNGIIRDVETDLEVIIERKRAQIKYTPLPVVEGSALLLYQLFYNLINNSLKFSKPDVDPLIEINAELTSADTMLHADADPGTTYYRITVRDNGTGFPQEFAEKIFHTFSRFHSKEKYEGTGMGLALCKSIAERHHGFMEAFGVMDKGATFHVYLPERG